MDLVSHIENRLFPTEYIRLLDRSTVLDEFRKRCQVTYLGDRTALCRVMGRFHMFVETTDVGFATHAMHGGFWEYETTQFIAGQMRPGMRVLDVGANYGYFSLLMSELIGEDGHCIAFEPNPKICKMLRDSLSVSGFGGRSEVFELALGDGERESIGFLIPKFEPKNAHVVDHRPPFDPQIMSYVDVASASLDAMAAQLGRVDFMKIDAEGAEVAIVRGMSKLLAEQAPRLLIEYNFARVEGAFDSIAYLSGLYGGIQAVGPDGKAKPVDIQTIATTRHGQDWLLYFSR
jgi:FkbM family methyltransferase